MKYVAGSVIFHEGDISNVAYVIESGRVEIYRTLANGERTSLALLEAGQMFGEMGVLDAAPRSASARAVTDVVVRTVDLDGEE
jgi:CRP-like cAMP-binding protein